MKQGDIVAFRGRGFISWLIRRVSSITHVEVIVEKDGELQLLGAIEKGVKIRPYDKVIRKASGEAWHLELSDEIRRRFDYEAFNKKALEFEHVKYDFFQFVGIGIDDKHIDQAVGVIGYLYKIRPAFIKYLKRIFKNSEDLKRLACSEVVWYLWKVAFGLEGNASEVTPIDACRARLYKSCKQIKGKPRKISKFNTIEVFNG